MSSDVETIAAELRDRAGKGAARAARRAGMCPAVIYGGKRPPLTINVSDRVIRKEAGKAAFFTTLLDIQVSGKKERVLPRDLQLHPVTDVPLHVDFLRVSASTRVVVAVPVIFLNEDASPGLEKGGVLNTVRHEVELSCLADSIPDQLEIDLTGTEVGDSLHASALTLPADTELTITDRDFTIATIAAPSALRSEEEEEAEEGEAEATEEAEESAAESEEE